MSDPSAEKNLCQVCQKIAEQKCSGCKLVFYCSSDHQKADWKNHREICKPYEICISGELGRHLRARRDLEPDDIIFSEAPLLFGPKPHLIQENPFPCVGCCKLIDQSSCAHCPDCFWPCCKTDCEGLKDQNRHSLECRILKLRPPKALADAKNFFEYFRFDILIVLRALFLQKVNKDKWKYLIELESHMEKRGSETDVYKTIDEKVQYIQTFIVSPLKSYERETGKVILENTSAETIHKIYGILDVNATEINDEIDAEVLYPTASLLEHNCTPNTCQIIDDNQKVTFKAASRIKKGDHITSIYTHILWGTQARREHLLQTKYFSCKCKRCKDSTEFGTYLSGLKCLGTEKEPCGGIQLPIKPAASNPLWVCNKCKIRLPNDDIMKFVSHLGGEVDKVMSNEPTVQQLEDILGKLSNFLHSNHYHLYNIKHTLIQLYSAMGTDGVEISNNLLAEKIKMCEDLLFITRRIDPGNARLSMYLAVIQNELFNAKYTKLVRNFEPDQKSTFEEEIRHIKSLVDESKDTLKHELNSQSGKKMFELLNKNDILFQEWLKENDIVL